MNDIGVCIVISKSDRLEQTKFFFERLLTSINNAPINFYIFSNACEIEMKNYLKSVADSFFSETENPKKTDNFIHVEEEVPYCEGYNRLFVLVKEAYIFSISNFVFLNDYWYVDLLNSADTIKNSGIISINNGLYETHFTSILVEDNMKIVSKPSDSNELIVGPYFMSTNIVRIIGGFDKQLFNTGYERDEICWRFRKNNLINYYVLKANCIDNEINCQFKEREEGSKEEEIYKNLIKEKTKNRIYKSQF